MGYFSFFCLNEKETRKQFFFCCSIPLRPSPSLKKPVVHRGFFSFRENRRNHSLPKIESKAKYPLTGEDENKKKRESEYFLSYHARETGLIFSLLPVSLCNLSKFSKETKKKPSLTNGDVSFFSLSPISSSLLCVCSLFFSYTRRLIGKPLSSRKWRRRSRCIQ